MIYESTSSIAANGMGIKEAALNTKHNSMNNDKSKYEEQMFEPAQRFLLMPCYASALALCVGSFSFSFFSFLSVGKSLNHFFGC